MFKLHNITKRYQENTVLQNVSMDIGAGLNFIVGASGSGKTTLLKILSGLDQDVQGEVTYCGHDIKRLSADEKAYFYNHVFGFVWQDFNLFEDQTVLENILLPSYLQNDVDPTRAKKILKQLKIPHLAAQTVRQLSGGQKQRVAIARELMKQPHVLICDEPTSALDQKASKVTMELLRTLSSECTIIIVTHDTTLIQSQDHVFELDKGELLSKPDAIDCEELLLSTNNPHHLSLKHACSLSKTSIRHKAARFLLACTTLLLSSVLLLTTFSGSISGNAESEFKKLEARYGDSLYDISIINSFSDASGTSGNDEKKPSGDIDQNIKGLYDTYAKDKRIDVITYLQAFDNIEIQVDGKQHTIESSGNSPVMNKLIAGRMPKNNTFEVIIPKSFAKSLGISPKEAIGKEIDFSGSIYDWSSGEPISKNIFTKATIAGVMDTTTTYEQDGEVIEFSVDDAFFFSKYALDSISKQAGTDINKQNFLIRAKTAEDMIAIKDECSANGIVPLGQFELVEDMVRLQNQSTQQSSSASIVIALLSIVMMIAIFLMSGFMRKKEFAIYRVSGYTKKHLAILNFTDTLFMTLFTTLFMFLSSPILNIVTIQLFQVQIQHRNSLFIGVLLILVCSIIAYATTSFTYRKIDVNNVFNLGGKA